MKKTFYSLLIFVALIINTNVAIAYDVSSEQATVTTLFETTDVTHDIENNVSLIPTNLNSALTTFNGATYFVWVDGNRHPQLTKITSSGTTTQRLDPDDNYQVHADSHHTFSLGIDKNGFIHVVGDMHNFNPTVVGENTPTYLSKFTSANAMYWVSDSAEDVSSFTFQGDNSSRSIPGFGFTYSRFYNDRNMGLYMIARTNLKSGYFVGVRAVSLYYYDTDSQSWTARGGLAPSTSFTALYPSILWEDDGNDGTPYQGFMTTLDFDTNNRMHFAATINNDPNVVNASHIVYAYSDDGGVTFHRADGSTISSLPMRVDAGDSQADIVETAGNGEYYWNFAGIFTDGQNIPSITVQRWYSNDSGSTYLPYQAKINTWDPDTQTWGAAFESPVGASNTTVQHMVDHSGVITYFSDQRWGQVSRSIDLSINQKSYVFSSTLSNIDRLALRTEGVYRMVSFKDDPATLSVIDIKFKNNGSFTREVWSNVAGGSLDALSNSPNFPYSPDLVEEVSGDLEVVSSEIADNFGSRLRGFIEAPEDGDYTFYISGDNHCEFWLSSDTSVENASMRAQVKWWTPPYSWFDYDYQESTPIKLQAGKRYYFEVMHKEGEGAEGVAVGWRKPNTDDIQVVEAEYLSPWFAASEGAFAAK
ncbi:BNR-4 repeat-containing protein [Alteromonas sp. 5E99-2]|uniref:BNR-4 repeat-containing protein n=1 Tax=Alteromonas sp. 5E99-2 TaxID=2817683 RepID=UPI001A98DD6A|nr:BNR-4 repeat-containing protein [Alteromonas sp. 5E99-2]MBO1254373.1 BNR-4 repeat-containing protein [Alteromonas sp. 5E99-2]